jgi:hypothetical protein
VLLRARSGWISLWANAQQPIELVRVDREPQALARLGGLTLAPGICRCLILNALCQISVHFGPCDFIRADYVQNFLAPGQQSRLLRSLGQGLAPGGVLASTITLLARPALVDAGHWRRGQQTPWGCRLWEDEDTGICTADLSLVCFKQAADVAGLACWGRPGAWRRTKMIHASNQVSVAMSNITSCILGTKSACM